MRIKIWLTFLLLSILLLPVKGEASTSMTMKNLEQELTTSLNDPSLTPGTEGYRSFVLNQLMFGQDQELTRQQNYSDLIVYMSGYINNLVLQENDFYAQTVQEVEAKQQERERVSQTTNTRLPSFVNATDVKAYAQKWWNHRNPEFPDFSDVGGNCVNYTSQLLLAGGINRISPTPIPDSNINKDPNYWYSYKKSDSPPTYNSSLAWINVGAFYNFWKESQELIQPNNLNVQRDLEVGDVIQLQHTAGGDYYHSMVVVDKDASTVYLTGNTTDRERMDIRELKDNNIRVIKFTRPNINPILPQSSLRSFQPRLNRSLAVTGSDTGARLTDSQMFNSRFLGVSYVPDKNAYRIASQWGGAPLFWTGETGVGNLRTDHQHGPSVQKEDHDLWLLEPVGNNLFIVRSWLNPEMVWDVHNFYPHVSTPIKVERLHPRGSAQRDAQIFYLEAN
ncbi:amidase domain-containing protein [Enterococcus innesii]|uniref:amidase domain-containing protein n=1 Tax=Enterococcus innesii TaxID=2839759 RepID=UPI00398497FF